MVKKQKALKEKDPLEINIGGFVFTETGVDVVGRPSFEDYGAAVQFAKRSHKASGWWLADLLRYGDTRVDWKERLSQAQDMTGLSEKTLKNVRPIGAIESARRRDSVEFGLHGEVASMEPDDQEHWLKEAEEEGWTRAELRMHIRASKRRKVIEGQATLSGMFRFIMADYPWPYRNSGVIDGSAYGRAEAHYEGMPLEEGLKLPVAAHALPVSTLYFWVPVPLMYPKKGELGPADLIDAWGFEYKSQFIWDKVLGLPGSYNHLTHEVLLVCTRGGDLPDVPTPQPKSVIYKRRSDIHSEKPNPEVMRMVEKHYTTGPYLYLFASEKVPGFENWSYFGNDARLWACEATTATG